MMIKETLKLIFVAALFLILAWGLYDNLIGDQSAIGNTKIMDYRTAKRSFLPAIWSENPRTFYCGCQFKDKLIKRDICGYKPKNETRRSKVREWEHIVPASRFGAAIVAAIPECRNVKRKRACLRKKSEIFNLMEADLHNIVPAIGEINAARRNFSFGNVAGEVRNYGSCDFEVGDGAAEAREGLQGDIARTYLYMADAYPEHVYLPPHEKRSFENWSKFDPPNAWERKRNLMIKKVQGNSNRFIE